MDEMVSRNELYDQYKDLLHYILKPFSKMKSPIYDYNDLFQIACLAMLESYDKYDPERGDFVPFLYSYVRGRIKQFINRNSSSYTFNKRAVSDRVQDVELRLDAIASVADTKKASTLEEMIGGIEDDRSTFELVDVAKKYIKENFPCDGYERNYDIWYRIYINGERQTDICKDYGITKQRINQILKPINDYIAEVYFEREA